MKFCATPFPGLFVIEIEKLGDPRGFFARTYCAKEFENQGLDLKIVQTNLSLNAVKGTIRGLHFQKAPHSEAKLVSCLTGAIWDVVVDIRQYSPMYGKHFSVELSAENRRLLYIPEDFAHGFQTLQDNTLVSYQMGTFYEPASQAGLPWNDPKLKIAWPLPPQNISEKDNSYPGFS